MPQRALAHHRPLVLLGEAEDARDHEQEDDDRGRDDQNEVVVARLRLPDQLDRRARRGWRR